MNKDKSYYFFFNIFAAKYWVFSQIMVVFIGICYNCDKIEILNLDISKCLIIAENAAF